MPEHELVAKLRERRAQRLRNGQANCRYRTLLSDNEYRVALVPLTEAEYDQCQEAVTNMMVPENTAGAARLDRQEQREVLLRAIRNPEDISEKLFRNIQEMIELLDPEDVNFLYDEYILLQKEVSPKIDELPQGEIDFLKKELERILSNELSGEQAYLLVRLVSITTPMQLLDSLPGFTSTGS